MHLTRLTALPFVALLNILLPGQLLAQNGHLASPYARKHQLLNGSWHYIIDPYETGYRNHRNWVPFDEAPSTKASANPYYTNSKPTSVSDRIEYDFDASPVMQIPGDFNHQDDRLLYYEGSVWFKTDFDADPGKDRRYLLYFGAVNYRADVYLNGKKAGFHEGGFSPFTLDVSDLLMEKNHLIVRVDNRREVDRVPNLTTDWWNYGGITRDVMLLEVPEIHVRDYRLFLSPDNPNELIFEATLNEAGSGTPVALTIPGLNVKKEFLAGEDGKIKATLRVNRLKRWYPERPFLYDVEIAASGESIRDKIGFRTLEARGNDILLNGQSVFLRGISLHEENPFKPGRVSSRAETEMLFQWARDLNCNFIRLAHYPHSEYAARLADSLGFLLWEEIPVYWGLDYANPATLDNAQNQLTELVMRDRNRASVIVWSVANETPVTEERLTFLNALAATARQLDNTRFISAALERSHDAGSTVQRIDDPFAVTTDLVSCNEYIGWYGSTPEACRSVEWDVSAHSKPFFISEFGGDALFNHHGDSTERWTEEYQAWLYREQLDMLRKIPSLRGMTPWILADFRSPRRNLPVIQDGWNRKGLVSSGGQRKLAFYVLRDYYREMEKKYPVIIKD